MKANTIINTNANDKDHHVAYSDKDSLSSKARDKRYYSDGFLKSKSASGKLGKHYQEYLEPDVKSLPTQNFFENNEIKINIQNDSLTDNRPDSRPHDEEHRIDKAITNSLEDASLSAKELNNAKKRFKSEEIIYSGYLDRSLDRSLDSNRHQRRPPTIKTTKSLANVVSYAPNEPAPFKITIKEDGAPIAIDAKQKTKRNKSSASAGSRRKQRRDYLHPLHTVVRLSEEPTPSTSTGITRGDHRPPEEFIKKIQTLNTAGTTHLHPAKNHDDTSLGAVHCFQDEKGNWLTYTFDENSFGVAQDLKVLTAYEHTPSLADNSSISKPLSSSSRLRRVVPDQKESYSSTNNFFIDYDDNQSGNQTDKEASINRMQQNAPSSSGKVNEYCLTYISPSIQSLNNAGAEHVAQQLSSSAEVPMNSLGGANSLGGMNSMIMHQNLAFNSSLNQSFPTDSSINYRELSNPLARANNFTRARSKAKPNQFYNWQIPFLPKDKFVKIKLDRLTLLALLDPCLTRLELYMSILLGILVAVFGSIIIEAEIFTDLKLIVFCFVIASCQYTLIKSVQPDAASPTHGYNRIIIYSRPVYFILISAIILATKYYREHKLIWTFTLYNTNLLCPAYVEVVEQCMKLTVLLFPVIFTFGFLPQINTFFMHLLEQIDIHVFGGSASTTGLTSALYSVLRSCLFVCVLFGIGLISISRTLQAKNLASFSANDYNAMFSVFCALLILAAYLLSRYSSDPTDLFNLTRKCYRKLRRVVLRTSRRLRGTKRSSAKSKRLRNTKKDSKQSTEEEMLNEDLKTPQESDESESELSATNSEEIEYDDPLPAKLERTLVKRLENDLICSIFITIIVFAVHVSTIFRLQPYVENTLRYLAISLGFLLNYVLPQLRKELPWLCFAKPFLQTLERPLFEVKSEAKVMWFDRLRVFLWLFEKNVVYPLVFLSAITIDTPLFLRRFGVK